MTVTIKSLADGQLASTKGTLYTTPASTQAIIKDIRLVNTSSSSVKVNLYFKASGGTSRRIIPKDTEMSDSGLLVVDGVLTLEAADILEGDAAAGSTVDFTISGVQNA